MGCLVSQSLWVISLFDLDEKAASSGGGVKGLDDKNVLCLMKAVKF